MIHQAAKTIAIGEIRGLDQSPASSSNVATVVYDSQPMRNLRRLLDRQRLHVDPRPFVYKDLSESLVRLMFPVAGGPVIDGAVAAVVCLFDRQMHRTLYAHPMHMGPGVNPLVRHLDGPMSGPQSQAGADGDRASRRIIEHKQALWDRFVEEAPKLGEAEAGRRWREGYYWALQRLYFCSGCTRCRWGSPFFEGPDPSLPRPAITARPSNGAPMLASPSARIVSDILAGDAWRIETAYAQRGGFTPLEHPRLLKALDDAFVQVIFPTDALVLQAGSLVAVAFTYHAPTRSVTFSHCLCAGPETEIQFVKGDVAFGLPRPQPGQAGDDALAEYRSWRRGAWSKFWLDDLESGPVIASENWLAEFWRALEALFGGNELPRADAPDPHRPALKLMTDVGTARGAPILPPQALENIGGKCFAGHAANGVAHGLHALEMSTLMVNLGRRCNQACRHCHVDAGPNRTEEMSRETVDDVLRALRRFRIPTLDITGGAPELNPHFRYLASAAIKLGCRVIDRCNLTILFEPGQEDLPEFLAGQGIHVTASLPSDQAEIADRQRGVGSFAKSIAALRKLNELGYGRPHSELTLNLVYNPSGTEFPPPEHELERRYRRELLRRYGVEFNRLLAMNNMPINRFAEHLKQEGQCAAYLDGLAYAFNPDTVDGLMCRHTLSVGWDGRLFDCDFNQVMDIPLAYGLPAHIRDLDADTMRHREINTAAHCFGCTAGAGSSCNGALVTTIGRPYGKANGNGRVPTPSVREAHS